MEPDEGFGGLGLPTPLEMWKQHVALLEAEIEQLHHERAIAKQNIAELIEILQTNEKYWLQVDVERLTWEVSALNVENSSMANLLRFAGLRAPERRDA